MTDAETTTVQRLAGGFQWHCQDVACSYVETADLALAGPTRDVKWDEQNRLLSVVGEEGETVGLSKVCNECRHAKGWETFWTLPK